MAVRPSATDVAIDPQVFREVMGHYPTGGWWW